MHVTAIIEKTKNKNKNGRFLVLLYISHGLIQLTNSVSSLEFSGKDTTTNSVAQIFQNIECKQTPSLMKFSLFNYEA